MQLHDGSIEVADNPAYSSPASFDASSVSSVMVTGDGGPDTLEVTAGTIAASLATSLIKTVSFSKGAAYSALCRSVSPPAI